MFEIPCANLFAAQSTLFHELHDYFLLALVILFAAAAALMAVQLSRRAAALDVEKQFRTLAEAIPQIVWIAGPDGLTTYINQRWYEMTGTVPGRGLGSDWMEVVHPDDREICRAKWLECLHSGKTFEIEYRLRNGTRGFRWYLDRAYPLRDASGTILQWFGTCTDIHDQMLNQQSLEEQIKQHTAALVDANGRLENEMRERALAQQELNDQNERMLTELRKRSNRATMLAKMAELLQGCSDIHDVFSVLVGMASKIFPELSGAVLLFNSSREMLDVAASWTDCPLPGKSFGLQDCWALRTGHLHYVLAGDHTARCKHVITPDRSYVCLPLVSQGESIGVLYFQMIEAGEISESITLMVNMFAKQVGLSIANLRLREALRNQSIRDPLTGVFNRRYLEETLEREVRRAARSDESLGVLMLDLDHFKKFNDTYGHEAGDDVLRETATFLSKCVRAEDVVCRYGGEEFVIILPAASLDVTRSRAEDIRLQLRDLATLHQGQPLGRLTASFGVACFPEHGATRQSLLEAADAALYRAKREGRDRVAVAESAPVSTEADHSIANRA
ncbi:MAG TPA: diguanylate cyclase [Candidatus Sulfotelmatobacter sp.]|nr:diguanylate cyclase [Candidatus Sulfotelmatobacter sp.]